jgi:hypothetical protein
MTPKEEKWLLWLATAIIILLGIKALVAILETMIK